jgi:iron complex outermembrane recepter protein
MRQNQLRYGCAAVALACGCAVGGAQAQTAPQVANPPAASVHETSLDEVVVTARRREELLQDVPVAVTAMTAERLRDAQVTTARELTNMVPSLNVNTGNQRDFQRFTLRGQGVTLGAGEGVGVYVAEAPIPQTVAGGPGLYFDLENLQVLNGPQGTLFGRNTTGGAVLFTPRRPADRTEGFVQLGLGNFANRELTGALNVPIVPGKLSIRLAGEARRRDGFTRSLIDGSEYDDINYTSYRLGVLFQPTDWVENYLLLQHNRSSTGGTGVIITDVNPAGFGTAIFGSALANELAAQRGRGVRVSNGESDHWWYTKNFTAINTTSVDLPFGLKLKNIASFTRTRSSGGFDIDGTPVPLVGYIRQPTSSQTSAIGTARTEYLTEELQLSGELLGEKLTWITGGFYQHYYPYGHEISRFYQFGAPNALEAGEKGATKAWFAQASLDLDVFSEMLEGLKLTAGYRYTWDEKSYQQQLWNPVTGACSGRPNVFYPGCVQLFSGKWAAPTYTLGLDYKVTPRTLIYATYRTGYKSGGFNSGADPSLTFAVFGPEMVQDYEVGLKTDFRAGETPVRVNLALFMDDYSAIQRNQTFVVPGSSPPRLVNLVGNSGVATIKGLEAQISTRLFDRVDLELNYSYLDTEYENDIPAAFIVKGTPLPYAPTHKIGGLIKYHLPIDPSLGDLSVNLSGTYQSEYRSGDRDQPGNILGDYALFNAGVAWRNIEGRPIDLELFMTNIFDKAYKSGSLAYYYAVGTSAASYTEPRMVGVRLRYNFQPE